ncbi:MAG: 2-oxo acid dehydrogenase subunit E2 [Maricaulaceae bacterium]
MTTIEIKVPSDNEEGTTMKIQKWLKAIGDVVTKDEPLVEIETDKVTMEIEAPADGVLTEITCQIGVDVDAGAIIGALSTAQTGSEIAKDEAPISDVDLSAPAANPEGAPLNEVPSNVGLSPSVRRFVAQNNIDISGISGSGRGGRLTLADVKSCLSHMRANPMPSNPVEPKLDLAQGDQIIPHSSMRLAIAKHMTHSVATAPHVTAVFELDFTSIMAHRAVHKAEFAAKGVKLTYTAYFIMACVEAMKAVPTVNSRWHDDRLQVFGDVNIGIGTSLGSAGLVVPVVKQAQAKSLFGIAQNLQDLTSRARDNKLKPSDVKGGTFTISNHGVSGSLVASPIIINQPQSAILGIGKLEKRVVVKTLDGQDVIAVKPMAFVSLTIDHRVLDGHQTNMWLSRFVDVLENWPDSNV